MSEEKWDITQKKTYTRWMNSFLKRRGKTVTDLFTDLADGVNLINLLEIIGGETLSVVLKKKTYPAPKNIMQRQENLNYAIEYVKSKGIELVNVGSGDIEKGNKKIILGLIFTIILRFSVTDLDGKKGLLLWVQRSTEGHAGVNVTNFTTSFTDGLAFLAIIHRYRPDLINYDKLDKSNHKANLELAFATAKSIGIERLLDVEDIVDNPVPDEKSIIAYVIEYWREFSKGAAQEKLLKIVWDSIKVANQLKTLSQKYAYDAAQLVNWINSKKAKYGDPSLPDFTEGIIEAISSFNQYTRVEKAEKNGALVALEGLLQQIITQAKSHGLKPYVPERGHDPASLKASWTQLGQIEDDYKHAALTKYDRFLRYDYYVRLFDSKLSRAISWIDENAAVFATSSFGTTVEEIDAKLDTYNIFKANYGSVREQKAELESTAGKVGQEHHAHAQVVANLKDLTERLEAVRNAGSEYQSNLLLTRAAIQKLNDLQKSYYVKAEEILFRIEALEGIISQPVLEGSEEGLVELQTILSSTFSRQLQETTNAVNELKSIAETLVAGGKVLSRDPNQYDDILNELSSKLNARTASLNLKIGVVRKDEELKNVFAEAANDLTAFIEETNAAVGNLSGSLESQQNTLDSIEKNFRSNGGAKLSRAEAAWKALEDAGILVIKNTPETVYSLQAKYSATNDIFGTTHSNIAGLIAGRDGAKAEEAARIEEIRKVFNFFDVDHNLVLRDTEFTQAVEGLGLLVPESEVGGFYGVHVNTAKGGLEFDQFVEFVKAHTTHGSGKNDVLNAFTTLSKANILTQDVIKTTFAENPELILSALDDYKTEGGFDYKEYVNSIYS